MAITRLNYFTAREGQSEALKALLQGALPMIQNFPGCQSCELLASYSNAQQFVVLEVWDSVEAHQKAVQAIPPEAFTGVMELLDGMPSGEYYTQAEGQTPATPGSGGTN